MSVDPNMMMQLLGQGGGGQGMPTSGQPSPIPGMGQPMNFGQLGSQLNVPGMGGNPAQAATQAAQPTAGLTMQQKMMIGQALMGMAKGAPAPQMMTMMQGHNTGY